jgi:cytosine/adenosine deaminase-related metal-dependent hydrolase
VTAARPSLTLRARQIVRMAGNPLGQAEPLRKAGTLENGWLRIERGRIAALGAGPPPGPATDLGDAVILPGLVNAHTHLEFSSLATPLDGSGGLPEWIGRVVALRRGRPTADAASAVRAGLAESAAAGVTLLGDIATSLPPGIESVGPRVRVFRETLGLSASARASSLSMLRRDLDRLVATGRSAGVSPHAPYSVAAPLGRAALDMARCLRLPAAMHLAESPAEAELVASGSGPLRTALERLGAWPEDPPPLLSAADWISLLARGPRGLAVHGTFLDDVALARLARHRDRLAVVICPRTTRLLSDALPPLERLRSTGVRVALGTDSRASNPDLSVLGECRALVDGGLTSPAEALRMATVTGAWALGRERRAGMLAPGRPADLVVLRPAQAIRDPYEAALDPSATIVATLRSGHLIHGALTG